MFYGFDTSVYPGDAAVKALRASFQFCGFYLAPAPSHQNTSWMLKRKLLAGLGYSFLPIYVGQQVTGPGSHKVTAAQGTLDGASATELMWKAGFAAGSPVFLDLENGAPAPKSEMDYVASWAAVVKQGGFNPGVYCSHALVSKFTPMKLAVWEFKVPTVGKTYDTLPYRAPNTTIDGGCVARQFRQNVVMRPLGVTVDINAAYDLKKLAS